MNSRRQYTVDVEPLAAQYRVLTATTPVGLYVGGIGSGKSFTGAVWCAQHPPGSRILMVAPSYRILRDGTLRTLKEVVPWGRAHKSEMTYTLPNGTVITMRSAENVDDTVRSVHADSVWFDEASYVSRDAINTAMGRTRASSNPRFLFTTTPMKNAAIYDMFVAEPEATTTIVTARTADNPAISRFMLELLRKQYGPRLAAQELDGQWVDLAGGLWERNSIIVEALPRPHGLVSMAVSVDPSVGGADECGIVVCAKDRAGHGWVLDDASGRYAVTEWPEVVVKVYHEYAKRFPGVRVTVVAEKNQGGHLVERAIRSVDKAVRYEHVTAKEGKDARAQPVAVAYRMGNVSHVADFQRLVSQMVGWSPGKGGESPDRLDAMVHGLTFLDIAMKVVTTGKPKPNPYAVAIPRTLT